MSPSLLRELNFSNCDTLEVMAPPGVLQRTNKNLGENQFLQLNLNVHPHCKQEEGLLFAVESSQGCLPWPREMFTTTVICYVLLILIAFQNVKTTVIFGRDWQAALISSVVQQI